MVALQRKISANGNFLSGAGNETRTRDPDLGKVVLYQLSYSRVHMRRYYYRFEDKVKSLHAIFKYNTMLHKVSNAAAHNNTTPIAHHHNDCPAVYAINTNNANI